MKISYLVTCHDEGDSLEKCFVSLALRDDEDEVIVLDDFSTNPRTIQILSEWEQTVKVVKHPLDKNYGGHKNFGNELCTGDWIFQIDGDEIPNETLVGNLKGIIEASVAATPDLELIYVPRINDFIGVTQDDAKQWGWRLTPCPVCDNRPIINWPDYQSRIYKKDARIKWDRRLHEKIEGHKMWAPLPEQFDFALYHDKTIETQRKTNLRYNEWFTQEENQGHNVFDQKNTGSKQ